jgi:hypothetical protein
METLPTGSLLAIHASKRSANKGILELPPPVRRRAGLKIRAAWYDTHDNEDLPEGAVVCICRVVGFFPCIGNGALASGIGKTRALTEDEVLLGDFYAGRYAWELEVVEVFDPPIPARGKQRLWEWERP